MGDEDIPLVGPSFFQERSGDRIDKATAKANILALVAEHGSLSKAVAVADVDRVTLSRYLSDGEFTHQLKQIEQGLVSKLVANTLRIATQGKEENQLKATEFLLPALNTQFDAGVRRQSLANRGNIDSILLAKSLSESSVELDPLLYSESMPDKPTYQASDIEPLGIGQEADTQNSTPALEPSISPTDDDYSI